jgi:glutathionyl-hydroquinone reductase
VAALAEGGSDPHVECVVKEAEMGRLIQGAWSQDWYDTRGTGGHFVRPPTQFRNWVTPDGRAGASGTAGFPAASGRYHLYVSLACPWAHRTLIFRKLKKLEAVISVSVVEPLMGPDGWEFAPGADQVNGRRKLSEIYLLAEPRHTGRVTVPVLWDRVRHTIVNNESAEIIRMFNSAFEALTPAHEDYYPPALRSEIDSLNAEVYARVNNGVYRAGFATTQAAYEAAFLALFSTLDRLEARLSKHRYLVGNQVTEADWRLFTTLVRFDAVYYGHFKCNLRRIAEYPQLSNYLRDLYQWPGIAETVSVADIKLHYYASHRQINPTGIVPLGPLLDFSAPHDRGRFAP